MLVFFNVPNHVLSETFISLLESFHYIYNKKKSNKCFIKIIYLKKNYFEIKIDISWYFKSHKIFFYQ